MQELREKIRGQIFRLAPKHTGMTGEEAVEDFDTYCKEHPGQSPHTQYDRWRTEKIKQVLQRQREKQHEDERE